MSWLHEHIRAIAQAQLISTVFESLAWPAAMIVIVGMLRAEVRMILGRVVHLKYHAFEAQFRRDLAQSEALGPGPGPGSSAGPSLEVDAAPPPPPALTRLLRPTLGTRHVLHELDGSTGVEAPGLVIDPGPRSVVRAAWSELVAAVGQAAGPCEADPIRSLVARGALAGPSLLLFERLRGLQSQMAARPDWSPTPDDARRFADLARPLALRLSRSGTATE